MGEEETRTTSQGKQKHPVSRASSLSLLFFWWTRELFANPHTQLRHCPSADRSHRQGDVLERAWLAEVQKRSRRASLLRVLLRVYWMELALSGLLLLVYMLGITLVIPELLGVMVQHFTAGERVSDEAAVGAATAAAVCVFLQALLVPHGLLVGKRTGFRARAALASLLYRKSLRVGVGSSGGADSLVTLLSAAAQRVPPAAQRVHFLWLAPAHAVAVLGLLYRSSGWPPVAGALGLLFIMVPLQAWLGRVAARLGKRAAPFSEARLRLLGEVLDHLRTVKMSAWEDAFEKQLGQTRSAEERSQLGVRVVNTAFLSLLLFSMHVAYAVFLGVAEWMREPLATFHVFVAIEHLYFLNIGLNLYFPRATAAAADALVTFHQMQAYLLVEDRPEALQPPPSLVPGAVLLRDAHVHWTKAATAVLRAVRLRLPPGALCVVDGPVGAGKSALLLALAGELMLREGDSITQCVGGRVALASQRAWAWSGGNVRDNILLGRPFNPRRYKQVLRACCLESDLRRLPGADLAPVGERGSALSGGQRARVSLARCCYGDADVWLLDDPLAALDARVARKVLSRCVLRWLKGRTRLVVTHALALLSPHAHLLIHVDDHGIRVEPGGGKQQTSESVTSDDDGYDEVDNDADDIQVTPPDIHRYTLPGSPRMRRQRWPWRSSVVSLTQMAALSPGDEKRRADDKEGKGRKEEVGEKGEEEEDKSSAVRDAFRFFVGGQCHGLIALTLVLHIACQGIRSVIDFWVGHWLETEQWAQEVVGVSSGLYVALFAVAVLLLAASSFVRVWTFRMVCSRSAHRLHACALRALLRTPLSVSENVTRGQLLSPFATDLATVDERLPVSLSWVLQVWLVLMGTVVVAVASQWLTVVPWLLFIACSCWSVMRLCRAPPCFAQLEATRQEPLLSLTADTVNGLSTIRILGRERFFMDKFEQQQDALTAASIALEGTNAAVNFVINFLVTLLISANVAIFFIFKDDSDGSGLGLVFYLSLSVSLLLPHFVETLNETLAQASAVTRIRALKTLPPEEDAHEAKLSGDLPEEWPKAGGLEFDAVCMRYSEEGPLALNKLSFSVPEGYKVGVIGRTGAGKSSLLSALLRLPPPCAGVVRLAGVDCARLPLHTLRRAVTIVPQESALFSGPLRLSLDPQGECSDAQLWEALRAVGLDPSDNPFDPEGNGGGGGEGIRAAIAKAGLEASLRADGSASAGERQLVCAARALLRPDAALVVLDEASASLDAHSDALLHRAVAALGRRHTVLAVAHRLQTVADADELLVMDAGTLAERGHPWELLQPELSRGYFAAMVKESGSVSAAYIRATAHQSWLLRVGAQRPLSANVRNSEGDQDGDGDGDGEGLQRSTSPSSMTTRL